MAARRGWLPSVAYLALVPPEALQGAPPEREASWHAVDDLPELALDHARIVDDGLWRLRARVADKAWFMRVGGGLLPEEFTLGQAQRLYEAIAGESLDPANFRRDLKATGLPEKYSVRGFPTLVILDQEGVIRDVHVGYSPTLKKDVVESVEKLLK